VGVTDTVVVADVAVCTVGATVVVPPAVGGVVEPVGVPVIVDPTGDWDADGVWEAVTVPAWAAASPTRGPA